MQTDFPRFFRLLALLVPIAMCAKTTQATVEDTGSTNRLGLRVTFDRAGHATIDPKRGEPQQVILPEALCEQFMQDVAAAGPVDQLPAVHCMKSVSFGSRTFVEYSGKRSPDISCPAGDNPHIEALQKDAQEILRAAREAGNIPSARHIVAIPAPRPQ